MQVCTTVLLTDGMRQKDCAIWPSMIKKPTTQPPTASASTGGEGLHPGGQAAIALAVILIIIIIVCVLFGVYLYKTKKYK